MSEGIKLNQETIEAIRQMTFHPAWTAFWQPALLSMREDWMKRMMDPSKERKDKHPDDYIRGCFDTIDVFLAMPRTLVEEHDAQRETDEREKRLSDTYEMRARTGRVGPYTSDDEPPTGR